MLFYIQEFHIRLLPKIFITLTLHLCMQLLYYSYQRCNGRSLEVNLTSKLSHNFFNIGKVGYDRNGVIESA